jgi:hypothetical protein
VPPVGHYKLDGSGMVTQSTVAVAEHVRVHARLEVKNVAVVVLVESGMRPPAAGTSHMDAAEVQGGAAAASRHMAAGEETSYRPTSRVQPGPAARRRRASQTSGSRAVESSARKVELGCRPSQTSMMHCKPG